MESELQEFVQLIHQAYQGTNNVNRRDSEHSLMTKCCTNPKGMEILVHIMLNGVANAPSPQHSEIIKESAALLTTAIVKRLGTSPVPYEKVLQLEHAKLFVNCLQSTTLNQKLKGHVAVSLSHLTGFSSRGYDNKADLRTFLQQHCQQLLSQQDLASIEGGSYLFQALISSIESMGLGDTPNQDLDWIQAFVAKGKDIPLALTQAQPATIGSLLHQYKLWSSNAIELCRRVLRARGLHKEQSTTLQNFLIMNEHFSMSLVQVLIFQLNQNSQTIISQTGDVAIDGLVNEAKGNALQCINLVLSVLINDRTKQEAKRSPFYLQLAQLIPTLIVCLIAYTTHQSFDVDTCLQNTQLQNMVTQMMKFVTLCGGQSEFYQLMSDSKTSLLVDVVFPFLATSKREQLMMREEPEEFVNLALDTIDKQSSEVPKTAAAALLETFCDHIDGSTSFIAQICSLIISHSIQVITEQSNVIAPESPFYILKDLQARYFFARLSPVQRIDTSLVALTVMSYLLSRRNDLISLLENMLKINFAFFSDQSQDPLITSRLCLFLGYYCDNLFKSDNAYSNLQQYIQVLLRQLQSNNEPWRLAVLYQAVDALKNMFEDEELIPKVKDLVPHLFPVLCQSLALSYYEQHFDMIMTQLKLYATQIQANPELFGVCLTVLVTRITYEQQLVQQGKKDSQLWINKCWNILRTLPEIEGYLPQHAVMIESYLIPLYKMLEEPSMVEFDEDIFLMVSATIEKTHMVTDAQRSLLVFIPQVQKKQKNRLGQMFEMLNNLVVHGKPVFQNVIYQQLYFSIAEEAMKCRGETSNEADEGEGVLLIQLAIQQLGPIIHTDVLKHVFQAILARSSQEVQKNFLKSRLMGVFLSAFLFDFDRTRQILEELGLLNQIFQQLIDSYHLCEPGYDIKLYIFAMSTILQKSPQVFSVRLVDSLVSLLWKQQQFEAKKSKTQDPLMDDSSEECIDDDESEYDDEKEEAQISMEAFKSELKDMDEYEQFKTTIFFIKQNLPDQINLIKTELQGEKLQYLQNVLGYARISQDGVLGAPRKIVKVFKRKSN